MTNLPLRFAFRYLFARKSHNVINLISGIGVAGMAIGSAALIVILSVFNGFNRLVSDSLSDADPDIAVRPATGKVFIPRGEAFEKLYDNPLILSMSSTLEEQVFLSYDGRQSLARVKGVDAVSEEESPLKEHVTDGKFQLHRGSRPLAVVGASLAYSLGIRPQFLTPLEIHYPTRTGSVSLSNPAGALRSVKVSPAATFSINAEQDAKLVLVPIETMRELLEYEEEISCLEIRAASGADIRSLVRDLSSQLGPDFKVLDRYHQNESLFRMMKYEKLAIYLILIFVIIIISFNIYSSLTMLIIEKQDDIGTLRSLGAPDSLSRRIFLLEGWLVSLLGLAIGLAAGIAIVLLQQKFGFVRMPGNYVVSAYPVVLKASDILWTVAGVAGVGYLIALIPSRKI